MAILKIKDDTGNIIDIPAIRGKSSYEYAQEGGFKGTEEEFKSLLGGLQDWADNALESSSNVSYATCDTEAAIAEKTVTISNNDNWKLNVGTVVMIYFSISNSASNVKLNVNGTGAYPIWYNNAEYTSTGTAYTGYAKRVIVYMFNGTHWVWISSSYDTNTTYTNASLGQGYVTCSTDASTTAKVGALSSYKLVTGGIVSVKFTNAVPANATLNVNSTGAKAIYYRGAKITADVIKAGDVATFIYSSQYHLISIDRWQNDITSLEETIVDKSVTPQMFGAIGDGETDDTEAINNALASGKNVFFPVGTYKVTSSLIVPYGVLLSGASGLSVIKTYITDGYVFKSETSNEIESLNLENLKFENGNTQDATTKLVSGNFIYDVTALYMKNCRVYKYYDVFYQVHQNSYIANCRFSSIYHLFCHIITDSVIDGCYINASRYGLPYKSKVFSGSFNSSAFTNNLVDYFFDVFAVTTSASGTITGSVFNRCVNVFHDHMAKMTIIGNVFTGMRSSEVDLSVLTTEQIASLEAEKWCVIKFDNAIYTGTHLMTNVTFANNIGYRCDYYFHVADGTQVVPAFCDFRGNQISTAQDNNGDSIVDVGFRSEDATVNAYNSMHSVYFDFWDMKEYETLPSAKLTGKAKTVVSFPYMRAIHNGDIYTNINGEWVKGGGNVELPDLSSYVTEEDLDGFITEEELNAELTPLRTTVAQQTPVFVDSIDDCKDKTKVYVLPDGYVYGYMVKTETIVKPGETIPTKAVLVEGVRYSSSSGAFTTQDTVSSLIIPVEVDSVVNDVANAIPLALNNMSMNKTYQNIYYGTGNTTFDKSANKNTSDYVSMGVYNILSTGKIFLVLFVDRKKTTGEYDNVSVTWNGVTIDVEVCADSSYAIHGYTTAGSTETIVTEGFTNTGHAFIPANSAIDVTLASIQQALGYTPAGNKSETWTFTLADGSTVTKKVVLA